MAVNTYLNNLDTEKVDSIMKETEENSSYFENAVSQMVSSYCADLDSIMTDLYRDLTGELAIDTNTVERYYGELTNLLYFMSDRLEKLNVYGDMAKSVSKEVYDKKYLEASSEKDEKGKSIRTIAENQSIASLGSQYESAVSQIYEHAYRNVKTKIDAANEMVTTLKNILKKRISDDFLNNQISKNEAPLEG